jgi:hypothetical protein
MGHRRAMTAVAGTTAPATVLGSAHRIAVLLRVTSAPATEGLANGMIGDHHRLRVPTGHPMTGRTATVIHLPLLVVAIVMRINRV